MKKLRMNAGFGWIALLCLVGACNSDYSYKKKGYAKISLPEKHAYRLFDQAGYPYSFEYPVYANVVKDTTYFESKPENDYWINLDFPENNAKVFLSYKQIGGLAYYKLKVAEGIYKDSTGINVFDMLVRDAYKLTNKNDVQASSISDSQVVTPNLISGVYFKVGGNAATSRQFFLSDTTRHFFRGALYFASTPNVDSLKPALDFYETDIKHLINTFKWKETGKP